MTPTRKFKKDKKKKGPSLRSGILLSFVLFTAIALGVLWLFQTVWLDDIYKALKMRDLEACANATVGAASDMEMKEEELSSAVGELATRYETCVSVYRISESAYGRVGVEEFDSHVNTLCFIHNTRSEALLNRMYKSAAENGGSWTERVALDPAFGGKNKGDGENLICVRLLHHGDGVRMILLNVELMPLASTVRTLRLQMIWISVILLLVAVAMAILLSHRLSAPLRNMSKEASKLALGDYDVRFDGGLWRESESLSAALNGATYELARLDKMQKDLIANVSHDLRTPLTMIAGYTEAMRDLPGEANPENMQIVIDETNRLTALVNDMVEVSRYQNGAQQLKISRFNLTKVVSETLERFGKLRERDGYVMTFEWQTEVFVEADESRILQVLYNLIGNAVNYTGEDKTVRIRQSVTDEGKYVLLEVIDTGCGIPEEQLPLVWERYYKVHDFHKRANVGTGLGLSIVKSILLLHGAHFGVKSRVGEGSNFWFSLPVSSPSDGES